MAFLTSAAVSATITIFVLYYAMGKRKSSAAAALQLAKSKRASVWKENPLAVEQRRGERGGTPDAITGALATKKHPRRSV